MDDEPESEEKEFEEAFDEIGKDDDDYLHKKSKKKGVFSKKPIRKTAKKNFKGKPNKRR